jgi:SAM-dependent methyltransferase
LLDAIEVTKMRARKPKRHSRALGAIGVVALLVGAATGAAIAQDHQHRHGQQGAHGGRSGVDYWLPRLESEGRDGWQRPELVIEELEISPGMTVADLGTGTGYFVPHLSAAVGEGGTVLALDVDEELVEFVADRARQRGLDNVEARVIAFDDPGFAPASVDRVLIVNTWHHIDGREAYAARLAESLRPGGGVYVVDFTLDSPHGPPKHHRLAAEEVASELAAAGLEVTSLSEELPWQYIVVGRNGTRE